MPQSDFVYGEKVETPDGIGVANKGKGEYVEVRIKDRSGVLVARTYHHSRVRKVAR